tara:strand:+ start:764 stop:2953 length:2190 start_codon:yes stop_codon:yes gene_type:complete
MNLVKESLAKLLAQEDLIVEHRQVDTAQFNVETRVLTLPMWHHNSNLVVDMLIAHEVGHALYTPNRWDFVKDVPLSFVNVTEDIRIEKLMKRRYEGLPKTFFGGYNVLASEDFFKVEDVNWDNLNIADKLNLHYKIGSFVDVPFNADEVVFREDALNIETFDDAIDLAKRMHAFAKEQIEQRKQQQEEEKTETIEVPFEGRPDLGEDTTEYPLEDLSTGKTPQEPSEEGEGEEAETFEQETVGGKEAGRGNGPSDIDYSADDVHTADTLDDAIKDLAQRLPGDREFVYVEVPKSLKKEIFISNEEVSNHVSNFYNSKILVHQQGEFADEYDMRMSNYYMEEIRESDKEYNTYKKQSQKEVSYLVKEFECKKAADGYARRTVSKTGVLDTTKLHTYKYNDDIFRKITTIPDAKNHGLIFNIDWSGSMSNCIFSTVKQVLSLVSFCRKVGIAYDVYSFTDAYSGGSNYGYKETPENIGKVIVRNFNMVNLLTSRSNNRDHEKQAKNLFRIARSFSTRGCGVPTKMNLGGTPLDESLIAMNQIIPEFKTRTGSQKVHVVCLTDGEGYGTSYGQKLSYDYDGSEVIVSRRINSLTRLRDRQTGQTYEFDDNAYNGSKTFVNMLRNRFPECSFMNIRLCTGGEWSRFKRECLGYDDQDGYEKADREWRKTKSFICKSSAYTVQYALSIGALESDTEFEVAEDATKAQIKRAFSKSLNAKKMNKKILSSFIEQIA